MKKIILAFILGAVVFSAITAVAVTSITADQVNYDENTTVKQKIDSLYTTQTDTISSLQSQITLLNKTSIGVLNIGIAATSSLGGVNIDNLKQYYKYFMITSNQCNKLYGWSSIQNKSISLNLNQEYLVHDSTDGYDFVNVSASSATSSTCWANLKLYN